MTSPIPVTEAQAQRAVKELFELYGWQVTKLEEDRYAGAQGIPDLLCVSPCGTVLWVEMKRPASSRNPKGRVRKAQRERLVEWRRRLVPCCVADGVSPLLMRLAKFGATSSSLSWQLDMCDRLMVEYGWWPGLGGLGTRCSPSRLRPSSTGAASPPSPSASGLAAASTGRLLPPNDALAMRRRSSGHVASERTPDMVKLRQPARPQALVVKPARKRHRKPDHPQHCVVCGAVLRSGHALGDLVCDSHPHDGYNPRCDPHLDEHLLLILYRAQGQPVNLYRALGCDSMENNRQAIHQAVRRLNASGVVRVLGYNGVGYEIVVTTRRR